MFFEYSLWFLPIIIILALIGTVLHSGLIGKRFSFLNKYDNVTKDKDTSFLLLDFYLCF